jgi:hypothetical protein
VDSEKPRPAVEAFVLALMEASSGLGSDGGETPSTSGAGDVPSD